MVAIGLTVARAVPTCIQSGVIAPYLVGYEKPTAAACVDCDRCQTQRCFPADHPPLHRRRPTAGLPGRTSTAQSRPRRPGRSTNSGRRCSLTATARKRRNPGTPARATSTTTTVATRESTADTDELDLNERVVAQVDWSIWRAVKAGHFRLAQPCSVCGSWLTATKSKRAGIGPRCAERAK